MHSCAAVVIPLHERVVFVAALNRAELLGGYSEISQTLDAVTGGTAPDWERVAAKAVAFSRDLSQG
jgi:hypothetical protein